MSDAGRARRVRSALTNVVDGLELAAGQAETGGWRWVSIAMGIALQGALVAALSGYDTAELEDVQHPGEPDKIAPIQTLLRNAASERCLTPPEKLSGLSDETRHALALIEIRNHAVHVDLGGAPAPFTDTADHLPGTLALIGHLCVDHPAFDTARHSAAIARINALIACLNTAMR